MSEKAKKTAKEANKEFAAKVIEKGEKVIALDEKAKVKYLVDTKNYKKGATREMGALKANNFASKGIVKVL